MKHVCAVVLILHSSCLILARADDDSSSINWKSYRVTSVIRPLTVPITAAALHGDRILAGTRDGDVYILDAEGPRKLFSGSAEVLALHSDGKIVAASFLDGSFVTKNGDHAETKGKVDGIVPVCSQIGNGAIAFGTRNSIEIIPFAGNRKSFKTKKAITAIGTWNGSIAAGTISGTILVVNGEELDEMESGGEDAVTELIGFGSMLIVFQANRQIRRIGTGKHMAAVGTTVTVRCATRVASTHYVAGTDEGITFSPTFGNSNASIKLDVQIVRILQTRGGVLRAIAADGRIFKVEQGGRVVDLAPVARKAGFIGITHQTAARGNGDEITDVIASSQAQRIGLQKGDIVLSMDNQKISKQEDLISFMRTGINKGQVPGVRSGDRVLMILDRAGEKIPFYIRLGDFPE